MIKLYLAQYEIYQGNFNNKLLNANVSLNKDSDIKIQFILLSYFINDIDN